MQWDLGLQGVGLVLGLALGFGLLTQIASGRHASRWLWPVSAAGYFVAGLLTSEVWFGWATGAELQPNIDGVSFDEVLIADLLLCAATVLGVRLYRRHRRRVGGRTA